MRVRFPALLTLTVSLMLVGAPSALAAPPGNDNYANATVVTSLPFSDTVSTTEATTEATDPLTCSGAGHSVWFTYTADADGAVNFNTFGSDFDTVLAAFTGSPGSFDQIACNDDSGGDLQSSINISVTSGTTYAIMASGCCGDTQGDSGQLVLNADVTGDPLLIDVTVSPKGSVNPKTGVAHIRGTVSCSEPALFHNDDGVVSQRIGRVRINAFPYIDDTPCGPEPIGWSMQVQSFGGLFVAGKADLSFFEWHAFTEDGTKEARQFDGPMTIKLTR